MRIKKIVLENIGPYVNNNVFDFETKKDKNIVLIGGKNGSGKTTLLKAIKYGLFGSFCLGLKTDSKKYFDEVVNLINSDRHKNNSITIHLNLMEDYTNNEYIISRKWSINSNSIEEYVSVHKNGELLSDYEIVQFFERIKSFTSPQLINSFIFDGEKIGNIIENGETADFIRQSFYSMFNINILNQLTTDINSYLNKKTQENISSKEILLNSLLNDASNSKNNIKSLEDNINSISQHLNELKNKKNVINKEFIALGGLTRKQQKEMVEESTSISKELEYKQKYIKYVLENELCFDINRKLMSNLKRQLLDEIPLNYLIEVEKLEDYLKVDLTSIKEKLNNKIIVAKGIHKISEDDALLTIKRIDDILDRFAKFKKMYKEKEDISNRLVFIRQRLINQEQISRFNELLKNYAEVENNISTLEQELNQKNKKKEDLLLKLKRLYLQIDSLNNEIRKTNTYDNSFIMATKTLDITDKFIQFLIQAKLNDVSKVAYEIFCDTIRKENYIDNIKIDNDFNVHLFDNEGKEKKLQILSAGEMQLLISSLIWAMFKVSGKNEFFIFDTPLARLDVENRLLFINNIIKTISDQVIVLSTDSEIVNQNYDELKSSVSRQYKLDYIEKAKSTKIIRGYF